MFHIKPASSIDQPTGNAFDHDGPDTLLVDMNAYLIAEDGIGAHLSGAWTVTINGLVGSVASFHDGLAIVPDSATDSSKVVIGAAGNVFAANAIEFNEEHGSIDNRGSISGTNIAIYRTTTSGGDITIKNSGQIWGGGSGLNLGPGHATIINTGTIASGNGAIVGSGPIHLTNSGVLDGNVTFSSTNNDVFTDFRKVGTMVVSGSVVHGIIDLGPGDDHFNGGAHAEAVRDGAGSDVYKLGGGNDTYIAVKTLGGTDTADTVDGGSGGGDTYDAADATNQVKINLGTITFSGIAKQTASGIDVGADTVRNFENFIGGSGADQVIGSSGSNTLIGGAGGDILVGMGGRDILTGGANNDGFLFEKLSDSGTKASNRDTITDFTAGDLIFLNDIDANSKVAGDQAFDFIGLLPFHHVAGELREVYVGSNTIVSGDVNGDGRADFSILLVGHLLLSASDFDL